MNELLERYFYNYEKSRKHLKWKMNLEILKPFLLFYSINNAEFEESQFMANYKMIKKHTRIFSHYRGYFGYQLSAIFQSKKLNAELAIKDLKKIDELLHKNNFKKGVYSTLCSLIIQDKTDREFHLRNALNIHQMLKKKYIFLTQKNDYPLAFLLSFSKRKTENILNDINYYYDNLIGKNFKKSQEFHYLAQLLSMFENLDKSLIIKNLNYSIDFLKNNKIKYRRSIYSLLGLLLLIDNNNLDKNLNSIRETYNKLDNHKKLKTYKYLNTFISLVLIILKNKPKEYDELLTSSINTTVESIIQTQTQAAITASIAASSATVAATSNS